MLPLAQVLAVIVAVKMPYGSNCMGSFASYFLPLCYLARLCVANFVLASV